MLCAGPQLVEPIAELPQPRGSQEPRINEQSSLKVFWRGSPWRERVSPIVKDKIDHILHDKEFKTN
jgi:hypothetical protein